MGDMADYALEKVEHDDELRSRYIMGEISRDECEHLFNEDGSMHTPYQPAKSKTCRCCGQTGLYWKQIAGKWRLHNRFGLHQCPKNPLKES